MRTCRSQVEGTGLYALWFTRLYVVADFIDHRACRGGEGGGVGKGVVANLARQPKGGDTDQVKAVAAGECAVAVHPTISRG